MSWILGGFHGVDSYPGAAVIGGIGVGCGDEACPQADEENSAAASARRSDRACPGKSRSAAVTVTSTGIRRDGPYFGPGFVIIARPGRRQQTADGIAGPAAWRRRSAETGGKVKTEVPSGLLPGSVSSRRSHRVKM